MKLLQARYPFRRHPRLVRYFLVGVLSFCLDVGILWLAYRVLHLPIAVATTMGFAVGLTFNFSASKLFTFGVRSDTQGQTLRYAGLLGVNYLLTLILVSASQAWGPGYLIGKVCAAGLTVSLNYFALGHWVFVSRSPGATSASTGLATDNVQDL
jgi:putative flippase GtrA